MHARERRQLRLFVRRDTYGRYVSVPRLPAARPLQHHASASGSPQILKDQLGGESRRVHRPGQRVDDRAACTSWCTRPRASTIADVDVADLERRLAEASRSWRDDFTAAVDRRVRRGARRAARPRATPTPSPRPTRRTSRRAPARSTSAGSRRSRATRASTSRSTSRSTPAAARRGSRSSGSGRRSRCPRCCRCSRSMGVEVVDERPYELEGLRPAVVHLRVRAALRPRACPTHARELFQDALRAVWDGYNEIDGFNALVLGAGLTWRQATVLRAYAKYMRQGNTPVRQDYIEDALRSNVDITRLLVQLFEARFDPGRNGLGADAEARTARVEEIEERITRALDDVASLDHDRILRSYLTHIRATLRTNYFQRGADGEPHAVHVASSSSRRRSPTCPSRGRASRSSSTRPRVEGVHLRFGAVARGGLRWSDRRDDFRTEVLGLVKAQMVKNTVIVPVGAKGGFFCKQLPDPGRPRRVAGRGHRLLQDLHLRPARHHRQPRRRRDRAAAPTSCATTATTPTSWSPPTRARRRSPTSPTASPRTTASGSATRSPRGGSVGYDHKAMGITARGAWVSVQRHFRELRHRLPDRGLHRASASATCPATCSATACSAPSTSGWSRPSTTATSSSTPTPTPATSFAERKRLFDLPRSSLAGLRHAR